MWIATVSITAVVITVLKLENLKAIHNKRTNSNQKNYVVITVLKLENLKAIHNPVLSCM